MAINLTPTSQAILKALTAGAANATELRQQTGRSKQTIDKAMAELDKAALISLVPANGDDDGPQRWQLTESPVEDDTPDTDADDADHTSSNAPAADGPDTGDHDVPDNPDAPEPGRGEAAGESMPEPGPPTTTEELDADDQHVAPMEAAASDSTGGQPGPPHAGDGTDPQQDDEAAQQVKLCRGCQDQMPTMCPCCWQKTTAYCGPCRKNLPVTRRGVPGEPVILANGLPKLTPGQLEDLVLDVMKAQPLPTHVGVTGWTSGRMAVFLPGRSSGAIAKALNNLVTRGRAEQLGDNPKRYHLKAALAPETPAEAGDSRQDSETTTAERAADLPQDNDGKPSADQLTPN